MIDTGLLQLPLRQPHGVHWESDPDTGKSVLVIFDDTNCAYEYNVSRSEIPESNTQRTIVCAYMPHDIERMDVPLPGRGPIWPSLTLPGKIQLLARLLLLSPHQRKEKCLTIRSSDIPIT